MFYLVITVIRTIVGIFCCTNCRLIRGKQRYIVPISLSDEISPAAIFYGTIVPVVGYYLIKKWLIVPFLRDQKEK